MFNCIAKLCASPMCLSCVFLKLVNFLLILYLIPFQYANLIFYYFYLNKLFAEFSFWSGKFESEFGGERGEQTWNILIDLHQCRRENDSGFLLYEQPISCYYLLKHLLCGSV